MRIPEHHDHTLHYVTKCGLELRRFVTSHENLSCFYDIRGVRTRMRDAPTELYGRFDLSIQQRDDPIPPKMLAALSATWSKGSLTPSAPACVPAPWPVIGCATSIA